MRTPPAPDESSSTREPPLTWVVVEITAVLGLLGIAAVATVSPSLAALLVGAGAGAIGARIRARPVDSRSASRDRNSRCVCVPPESVSSAE